jgi:N-acetylglucosamine-6-phosphate deacetylase
MDKDLNKKLRSQGIAVRLVAPTGTIIKGTSTLVTTGDHELSQAIVKEQAALHLQLANIRGDRDSYPSSPMGALTLVRQAFYDAQWYAKAWSAYRQQAGLTRPEQSEALEVLQVYPQSELPVVIDASNELYFLRADQVGREFELNVIVRGSGREYRRLDAIRQTGRAVIVPLAFSEPPDVKTPENALNVSLEDLMHWDLAPENPAMLVDAGVRIAFTLHGLKDQAKFLEAVRKAVARGLSRDAALAALTVTPAELFGMESRLGTLEQGKSGHVLVVEGDLFDKKGKVVETWIDGRRYETSAPPPADVRGTWLATLARGDDQTQKVQIKLAGEPTKLSGTLHKDEKEVKLQSVTLNQSQLAGTFKGESLGWEGVLRFSATVTLEGNDGDSWLGTLVLADGTSVPLSAQRAKDEEKTPGGDGENGKPDEANEKKPAEKAKSEKALYQVNYPLGALGRAAVPERPKAVLFTGATVWTSGPQGRLENASVLVEEGRIKAVGRDIEAPAGALVIDAAGKHLTPGILDCHSHIATDGGINESGQTITAEVRIGDFVNPNDVSIYRQLAGGVTTVNVLHGSANTIGGQNQVIKLRWGALPEEMKLAGAPPGIKFALGENVKQANWGERFTTRYPQTRMGVEQLVLDAFRAAKHYQQTWETWKEDQTGIPPRKDLELEALSEILQGRRWIHCHSYRQDEILAFLRTCAAFNVRVATLQHVLEGYKIADLIAAQGVGGSSFSDWWAYKFEVYDAIPYNGALMHNAGVLVSFNSDYPELARRLNWEAAKAVKYGGVPEIEALKFVTINPARQLRIEDHIGSLEPGKDADLVIWSGSPLSTFSHCEQTWIDGRKYFDRQEDLAARAEADKRKAALVQRVLALGDTASSKDGAEKKEAGVE